MKAGLIGVGQMGCGIARRLLDRGHALTVYNRTPAAAKPLRALGAAVVDAPEGTFDAEVVITMLADDAAVEAVWLAGGLVERLPAAVVHLNMASVSLDMGKRLAAAHRQAGGLYVSAPVFGRPEVAARGGLDVVAAGPADAIERCVPLFEALAARWFNVGADAAHANLVKIARNFLLAATVESLGEAFALVQKSGLAPATLLDIITGTSMNAPAFRNYGRRMIDKPAEVTFPLRLGLKDVELALAAARDTGVPLPTATLIREQHLAAIAAGYGEREWAALGEFIAESAGIE